MATILILRSMTTYIIFSISPLTEGSTWSLKKIERGVLEEESFKGVDGQYNTIHVFIKVSLLYIITIGLK